MRRRTVEERYRDNVRKQQKTLEEYADHEIEWADDLMRWYGLQKKKCLLVNIEPVPFSRIKNTCASRGR
ncbi:MAG: hypothetical protein LBE79_07620 [Tannerella sp.]|nr:hypothetical protein [Tannerella sp.]